MSDMNGHVVRCGVGLFEYRNGYVYINNEYRGKATKSASFYEGAKYIRSINSGKSLLGRYFVGVKSLYKTLMNKDLNADEAVLFIEKSVFGEECLIIGDLVLIRGLFMG